MQYYQAGCALHISWDWALSGKNQVKRFASRDILTDIASLGYSMLRNRLLSVVLMAVFISGAAICAAESEEYWMYVGTYTSGGSRGIYPFRFRVAGGELFPAGEATRISNPSFLALHPNNRYLYSVSEVSSFQGKNGAIAAFLIDDKTGALTFLNTVSSEGGDPSHLAVDKTGKWLATANYKTGSVSVFPVAGDGKLGRSASSMQHSGSGKDAARQEGPHAHSVNFSPDNRFLLVSDLGLDRIMIYRFDSAKGTLAPNDPPFATLAPGAGPRHLSFHPNGRFVYQVNELNSTLTVFAFDRDAGSLRTIETVPTLPKEYSGANSAAEVAVHPDGSFLYASNRGHDSIAVFAIKDEGARVEPVEHVLTQGRTPRHFALDPTGNFLFAANQHSGIIVGFRIDRKTGKLVPTGNALRAINPACILFAPKQ
jgi:6-phosphogluconolactonase